MPPEYLSVFLEDESVPEADVYLGMEEDDASEPEPPPSVEDLQSDPDIQAVLEAAAALA